MPVSQTDAESIALSHVAKVRAATGTVAHSFHVDAKRYTDGSESPAGWSVHVSIPAHVTHEHGHPPDHTPPDTIYVRVDDETGNAAIIPKL